MSTGTAHRPAARAAAEGIAVVFKPPRLQPAKFLRVGADFGEITAGALDDGLGVAVGAGRRDFGAADGEVGVAAGEVGPGDF